MTTFFPGQCRAARGLLDWSQSRLSAESHLSETAIRDFEKGRRVPNESKLATLQAVFESAGIELISDGLTSGPAGVGVRLKFPAQIVKRIDILENEGGPVREDNVAP